MAGDGTIHDDYDRACDVEGSAGVNSTGPQALAPVLAQLEQCGSMNVFVLVGGWPAAEKSRVAW